MFGASAGTIDSEFRITVVLQDHLRPLRCDPASYCGITPKRKSVVGKVKTVSVKREGKRWYVVLTAEQSQPEPLSASGSVVGIDMGIVSFLTTSNGEHVKAPTPKPDPETPGSFLPNGFAAKAGLNHSISDAGWGCS
jgi:hypothetical protein